MKIRLFKTMSSFLTGIKITAATLIECLSKVTKTDPLYIITGDLHQPQYLVHNDIISLLNFKMLFICGTDIKLSQIVDSGFYLWSQL